MYNMKKIISFIICFFLFNSIIFASASTFGIKVDTKKCKVYVYEQIESNWQLIGTRKCCVGANGKTPKGNFTIGSKKKTFLHNEKNYDYVSYFSGKCAFHSVPRANNTYDYSSLGHKRSNGCIRLAPEDAKWIYKYCKHGTKVIIE